MAKRGKMISEPAAFEAVREAVKALGIEPASAEIAMLPQNYVKLEGKAANQMVKLMEALDDHEDVQARLVELRHRREGDRGLPGVRVFGIDPGSERTGYGCIDTDGRRHHLVSRAERSPARPHTSFPERLLVIHVELGPRCSRECRPDCVAIENLFYATNVRSALKLGHARGVAMVAAVAAGVPIAEYTPAEIKRAVVGYGRADKHQVQQMVKLLLGLSRRPVAARRRRRARRRHLPRHTAPSTQGSRERPPRGRRVRSWRDVKAADLGL